MVHPSRWPRVLIVVGLLTVSLSATARAQSFSTPVTVSTNTQFGAYTPQVAVDSNGNIYAVWEDDESSNNIIMFSRSTDGGKTWSTPYNISKSNGFPLTPRIVIDGQGGIDVVYVDDAPGNQDIFFARSTNGGSSFSTPLNLSNDPGDSTTPELAVDSNGTIHVVWADTSITDGIFYSRSNNGGASFSAPVNLDPNSTSGSFAPQVAVAASGNVYVVWDDLLSSPTTKIQVFFSASTNNGLAFSAAQNLSNDAGNASSPQMALDSNGNINIVWTDNTPGNNDVFFTRSSTQGAAFSTPKNLSNDAGASTKQLIGVDSKGNIFVVWQDTVPPNASHDIWVVSSSNGGATFSAAQNLSQSAASSIDSANPWLTVDPTGHIDVAWEESVTSAPQIFFTQSTNSGASFAPPTNASNDAGDATTVQIAGEANGSLDVVWSDDVVAATNQIFFSRYSTPNKPPVAVAGADQTVVATSPAGAQVALDGTGSNDPDGDALTFAWTEGSTPIGNTATVALTASIGVHTYTLTVTDPVGLTSTATTHVTVNNAPPVVNPGTDQTLAATGPTTAVTLNGSATDVDGGTLSYSWSQNGTVIGNTAVLPLSLRVGTYTFALTVTDGNASSSATTHVTINDAAPVVSAGADQTLTATGPTTPVNLSGSASDVDGGSLTYSWSQNGTVLGSTASLQVSLSVGTYTFTLTVTDGNASSSATTHVTVNNATPVVNAGADQTLTATGPTTGVTLSSSATDVDGGTLTYSWTQNGNVVGSTASVPLSLGVGTYTFILTVTDGNASASATTHVTVNNATPVVNAGADQTLTATGPTTPVTLTGSASDVDGGTLTYSWTQNGNVVGSAASVPLNLGVGTYTFVLTVTDGNASASATTHVTINNATPVVNAGADQTLTATGPTTGVTLSGSGTDVDGGTLTFSWSQNGTVIGNTAALPLNLKVGTYTFVLTVTDGNASASAPTHVTVNNAAPVVSAGADQTLTATGPTTAVTLSGSATDVDGGTLTYSWTQNGNVMGSTASAQLSLGVGTYTFTLTVTDGNATSSAVTHVTINDATPVANAGADQTLTATGPTTAVTLTGSGSDVDGGTLTFSWSQNGTVVGNTAVLPLSLKVGTYTFTLTVTDGNATSSAVTHVAINDATPVANAGADQTLTATGPTTPVTLNGSGSDVDGGTLTFSWSQNGTVVGNTAVLPLNLKVGTYTFTLTVTDGTASSTATTHVTINDATPVANAGADQTLTATGPTTPVTLNGSGSDVDGGTLTYSWSQSGAVIGNTAVLPLSLKVGTYTFTLTVTDGSASSSAVTHVTINNAAPVANAGPNQNLAATPPRTPVTLNGSLSSDPDGDPLTYVWTQGGTVVGNSAIVQLSLSTGTYTFTLTVTDAGGLSSSAVTQVTINPPGRPPVAVVAGDPVFECTGPNGTQVKLDGSASYDPNSLALRYTWRDSSGRVLGNSAVLGLTLGLGTYTYTLTVTDSAGLSSQPATTVVVVQDTKAPTLKLSVSPTDLWPPDHKMKQINAAVSASDVCDAHPSVKLVSITSNDPAHTSSDNSVQAVGGGAVAFGTDVQSFLLRAELTATGTPLVYTITYTATDASGNSATNTAFVVVAHHEPPRPKIPTRRH